MASFLKKLSDQKITNMRRELARARLIVALLCGVIVFLVLQNAFQPVTVDLALAIITSVLLGIVGLTSITISLALFAKQK
jgi:hypothetical protein